MQDQRWIWMDTSMVDSEADGGRSVGLDGRRSPSPSPADWRPPACHPPVQGARLWSLESEHAGGGAGRRRGAAIRPTAIQRAGRPAAEQREGRRRFSEPASRQQSGAEQREGRRRFSEPAVRQRSSEKADGDSESRFREPAGSRAARRLED